MLLRLIFKAGDAAVHKLYRAPNKRERVLRINQI